MQTRRQSSVLGRRGQKNIFRDEDQKKRSLLQLHLRGIGLVAFFWGMIFALGAQKPPLTWILPSHSGKDQQKKEQKSLKMYPSGIGPVAFLWGTIFAWEHTLAWVHKNLL